MLRNSFPLYEDTLICLLQHSFSKPLSLYILISHNLRGKTIMKTMADILDRVGTIKSMGHDGGSVSLISYGKLCGNVLYLQQKFRFDDVKEVAMVEILFGESEAAAEEFAGFLSYEKRLSKEEVRMYAILWSDLVEDNSPLRSVINGKVLGVPEDFYDFQIWKRLTENPIKEVRLIGDILGHSQISIGDWWYAKRIEYYIQHKKIRIVEDSVNKYARTICLAKD